MLEFGGWRKPALGFEFGFTDDGETKISAAFPFRCWLTLDLSKKRKRYRDDREWGFMFNLHDVWHWSVAWNSDPWEGGRSWIMKDRFLDFVFGSNKYTCEKIGEPFDTLIPMPEASYPARLQHQVQTWRRPRWPFPLVRKSTDIEIPNGVPFSGKGENSWDCGEDGVYGMGSEGHNEATAVGKVVEYVYRMRKKRGDPLNYERAELGV